MAALFTGKDYTFTDTAAVSLSTIFGGDCYLSTVAIRANSSNSGNVVIGDSTVTSTSNILGFLKKDEAISLDLVGKFIPAKHVYLQATTNDRVHIITVA